MIIKPKKKLICVKCLNEIDKEALATPFSRVWELEHEFNLKINLDVCATEKTKKCFYYFDKEMNALNRNWMISPSMQSDTIVWCQAPHKLEKLFVQKAIEQWRHWKIKIIMMLPLNCLSANYFRVIKNEVKIYIMTGRIKFLCPNCGTPTKLNSVNGYAGVLFP